MCAIMEKFLIFGGGDSPGGSACNVTRCRACSLGAPQPTGRNKSCLPELIAEAKPRRFLSAFPLLQRRLCAAIKIVPQAVHAAMDGLDQAMRRQGLRNVRRGAGSVLLLCNEDGPTHADEVALDNTDAAAAPTIEVTENEPIKQARRESCPAETSTFEVSIRAEP